MSAPLILICLGMDYNWFFIYLSRICVVNFLLELHICCCLSFIFPMCACNSFHNVTFCLLEDNNYFVFNHPTLKYFWWHFWFFTMYSMLFYDDTSHHWCIEFRLFVKFACISDVCRITVLNIYNFSHNLFIVEYKTSCISKNINSRFFDVWYGRVSFMADETANCQLPTSEFREVQSADEYCDAWKVIRR